MDKDYLLKKWLNNDLSSDEKTAFDALEDSKFNHAIIEGAKSFRSAIDPDIIAFERFKHFYKSSKRSKVRRLWNPLSKIAAVLIVGLGLYFTFFFNSTVEIIALANQKITTELPDQSVVVLNANSKISYSKNQWNINRNLKLQGEAYFKVSKGKTFEIITSDGVISVIGTEFNVKQRPNYFEVKCFEGIVMVNTKLSIQQLLAGDTYIIVDGVFSEGKTDILEPSWINNSSLFEEVPIYEVLAELERQFDIEITTVDVELNRRFTGGFSHNDLNNALLSITQPMNLTYEMPTSNRVVIHGEKN